MYSCPSTSNMLVLVIRASSPTIEKASTKAGRTKWCRPERKPLQSPTISVSIVMKPVY